MIVLSMRLRLLPAIFILSLLGAQVAAALILIKDLKQRGLLDSTLVGEFGRTPMSEIHNRRAGVSGRDRLSARPMSCASALPKTIHVHDLQATILNRLGLDHSRTT